MLLLDTRSNMTSKNDTNFFIIIRHYKWEDWNWCRSIGCQRPIRLTLQKLVPITLVGLYFVCLSLTRIILLHEKMNEIVCVKAIDFLRLLFLCVYIRKNFFLIQIKNIWYYNVYIHKLKLTIKYFNLNITVTSHAEKVSMFTRQISDTRLSLLW